MFFIFNLKEQNIQTCLLINGWFIQVWFLPLFFINCHTTLWRWSQKGDISQLRTNTLICIWLRTVFVIVTPPKRKWDRHTKTNTSASKFAGVVGLTMPSDYVRKICANCLTAHIRNHQFQEKYQGQRQNFRHLDRKTNIVDTEVEYVIPIINNLSSIYYNEHVQSSTFKSTGKIKMIVTIIISMRIPWN